MFRPWRKIKANGGDIEVWVKNGWGHGFTANFEPEFEPDAQIFSKFPLVLLKMTEIGTRNVTILGMIHVLVRVLP